MPSNFVPSFANRLNKLTPLEVKIGRKDDMVLAGKIIIAPGSRNMIIKKDELGRVVVDYTHTQYEEFKGQASLSTWVYRIMVNEALQKVRKAKRRKEELNHGGTDTPKGDFGGYALRSRVGVRLDRRSLWQTRTTIADASLR